MREKYSIWRFKTPRWKKSGAIDCYLHELVRARMVMENPFAVQRSADSMIRILCTRSAPSSGVRELSDGDGRCRQHNTFKIHHIRHTARCHLKQRDPQGCVFAPLRALRSSREAILPGERGFSPDPTPRDDTPTVQCVGISPGYGLSRVPQALSPRGSGVGGGCRHIESRKTGEGANAPSPPAPPPRVIPPRSSVWG